MVSIRIVPVLAQGSAHIFAPASLIDPWVDKVTGALTSALQPNLRFDMLGACSTQEMYDTGVADATDSISAFNAKIDSLFYQTKNGKVHKLDVSERESCMFRAAVVESAKAVDPDRRVVDAKVMLDSHGVPTTWAGKALRKLRDIVGHRELVTVHVMGYVDLNMGSVEVQVIEPSNATLKVVGYTLDMARVNYNRRPRQVEHA